MKMKTSEVKVRDYFFNLCHPIARLCNICGMVYLVKLGDPRPRSADIIKEINYLSTKQNL